MCQPLLIDEEGLPGSCSGGMPCALNTNYKNQTLTSKPDPKPAVGARFYCRKTQLDSRNPCGLCVCLLSHQSAYVRPSTDVSGQIDALVHLCPCACVKRELLPLAACALPGPETSTHSRTYGWTKWRPSALSSADFLSHGWGSRSPKPSLLVIVLSQSIRALNTLIEPLSISLSLSLSLQAYMRGMHACMHAHVHMHV